MKEERRKKDEEKEQMTKESRKQKAGKKQIKKSVEICGICGQVFMISVFPVANGFSIPNSESRIPGLSLADGFLIPYLRVTFLYPLRLN